MTTPTAKTDRLLQIAQMYYEQHLRQSEIAHKLNISRPLVSRLLNEAREAGIVHIEIRSPLKQRQWLWDKLAQNFGIQGGLTLPLAANDHTTNRQLAAAAIDYLLGQPAACWGVGWGTIIGELTAIAEQRPAKSLIASICPLVGNSGVSSRNYRSDETIRILARQFGAQAHYLYAPAFVETAHERSLLQQLQYYQTVYHQWEQLDLALVNIGNYPSVPDFACASRYGDLLTTGKAKGRLLAYYFNRHGQILQSETDYALQIPLELLQRCSNVIGICSANTTTAALHGALSTGLLHQIIAPEELLRELID